MCTKILDFDSFSRIIKALTSATKPLLRQIDTLQHVLTTQRLTEENLEKTFRERQSTLLLH